MNPSCGGIRRGSKRRQTQTRNGVLADSGDFFSTGDNPWINVDHGAICLTISEAGALVAAVALSTVTVFAFAFVGFFTFASVFFTSL